MKAKTSIGELFITFAHSKPKFNNEGEFINHGDAGTYCMLKDEDGVVVAQSHAVLSPADGRDNKFDKVEGRKYALKKLVDDVFYGTNGKPDRAAIWGAYINRNPITDMEKRIFDVKSDFTHHLRRLTIV